MFNFVICTLKKKKEKSQGPLLLISFHIKNIPNGRSIFGGRGRNQLIVNFIPVSSLCSSLLRLLGLALTHYLECTFVLVEKLDVEGILTRSSLLLMS